MTVPRVLFLSDLWAPFPGGAERLAFNLSRDLVRRGYQVLAVTGYEHACQFDGPTVCHVPLGVFDTRDQGAANVVDLLGWLHPEVIVTHHLYAYQYEPELQKSRIPVVQIVLNTRRLVWVAHAVYISQYVRRQLGDSHVDDQVILPPVFDDVIADRHGDMIGFIKPIAHKGVEHFYNVAAALPDRQFLVLRGEWQDLEDIRPATNVTFLDPVDDIRDFYTECRLVLMPSVSEDAGTVAQEAALNRIPCISSDVGGLPETNGGLVLPAHNVRAWVDAIERLDDPAMYTQIVEQQQLRLQEARQDGALNAFADRVGRLAEHERDRTGR